MTHLVFDAKVPKNLKGTQEWFGSIISRPIDLQSQMNPISPKGVPMQEEAKHFIRPSPTLLSHQRIEIYNQQYWWRLLSTMHDICPLLTRLFGYELFNQIIAIPYLDNNPPNHWSLNTLGKRLHRWLEETYHEEDRPLILNAALLDSTFNDAFLTEELPPLTLSNPNDLSSLLTPVLYLQPHLYLFHLPYNLFDFRIAMLKEDGDHWIEHDFPKLPSDRDYFFVLFRDYRNNVTWEEISQAEFDLLTLFKKGASVENVCAELENLPHARNTETMANLGHWFHKWAMRKWLTLKKPTQ